MGVELKRMAIGGVEPNVCRDQNEEVDKVVYVGWRIRSTGRSDQGS